MFDDNPMFDGTWDWDEILRIHTYNFNVFVNDSTDSKLCLLKYTSVEKVATAAMGLGQEALVVKLDVKSAYRLILVYPLDRPLLGIDWLGYVYVDGMLPLYPQDLFGCSGWNTPDTRGGACGSLPG